MANFDFLLKLDIFRERLSEQRAAIKDFWEKAGLTLAESGITLKPFPDKWNKLDLNYFSVLFIAIFFILKIPFPALGSMRA